MTQNNPERHRDWILMQEFQDTHKRQVQVEKCLSNA